VTVVQGPAWTEPGLEIAAGRYPLSVERHVLRMADLLVPGVTTVTPHARYYALHALVAGEVSRSELTAQEAQDLLRRTEVALAAVSFVHDHGKAGLPRAHGVDALAGRLGTGVVDVAEASRPGKGGYVQSAWGFWNPYFASEVTLGILEDSGVPTPGPACDSTAVREGLGELLDLARRQHLSVEELRSMGHLCVCAGGASPDGRWLARLLCAPDRDTEPQPRSASRRATIQLLSRVVRTHNVRNPIRDVGLVVAYGDFITTDPIAADLDVSPVWRGVVLRNYAVGAWRRLWAWLVDQVEGLMSESELADRFADTLAGGTVGQLLDGLPSTVTATGAPAPAEQQLRESDLDLPMTELSVLAVGARRVDELTGRARDAFLGQRGVELGPEWTGRKLNEARPMPLRDFGRNLTADLVTRSQRVALSKARRRVDGTLWLPTRLHQRGDLLFRTNREGSGDAGLRLNQLTSVLAGAGVLRREEGAWRVTAAGEDLLG
jgi:hypothetical protein